MKNIVVYMEISEVSLILPRLFARQLSICPPYLHVEPLIE